MSKRRFVTAHGRRIEVEEVVIPGLEKKSRPSSGERFARLTKERLKLLSGLSVSAIYVYCHLLMINWQKLRKPVKLTNAALAEIGVSPDAKLRALAQLEYAGLVKVERGGHQAPIVTPLK
jgi:hypothetical protein